MSKPQFGTFDDLLQMTEESLRPVATSLRELIIEIDPNAACRFGGYGGSGGHVDFRQATGYRWVYGS